MSIPEELDISQLDLDTSKDELLLAAAQHEVPTLRMLLRTVSPDIQDIDTGFTPLHAAIAACGPDEETQLQPPINGHAQADNTDSAQHNETTEMAEKTLRLLFQHGASWNAVDQNMETPGCIAHRLGLQNLYEIVVDAGVRAELLLNRLDEYQPLPDGDEEEHETQDAENEPANSGLVNFSHEVTAGDPQSTAPEPSIQMADSVAGPLAFLPLSTSDGNAPATWEKTLMQRTAAALLPTTGLNILTIGAGPGLFDSLVQEEHTPAAHHIITTNQGPRSDAPRPGQTASTPISIPPSSATPPTASPQPSTNITVHNGSLAQTVNSLTSTNTTFDAIFFNTAGVPYAPFRDFATEHAGALLAPEGRLSFVHGLGADRQVSYDVYTKVVEMDLFEAGFDVEWELVDVPEVRSTDTRWNVQSYRLPVCRFVG